MDTCRIFKFLVRVSRVSFHVSLDVYQETLYFVVFPHLGLPGISLVFWDQWVPLTWHYLGYLVALDITAVTQNINYIMYLLV